MKHLSGSTCAFALLSLILAIPPLQAQNTQPSSAAGVFSYDVSQEITRNGTVSTVLAKPIAGMIPGPHLLLTTASGSLDVSLGLFGLQGEGALSVAAGQQVLVTGVMNTLKGQRVFVARVVKVGDRLYLMRNKHGIPLSPAGRQRFIANANQNNGESL